MLCNGKQIEKLTNFSQAGENSPESKLDDAAYFAKHRPNIIANMKSLIASERYEEAVNLSKKHYMVHDDELSELSMQAENLKQKSALAAFDWKASVSRDDFNGLDRKFAVARSKNSASFDFPYAGENHMRVMFRRNGKSLDAMLLIDKGQFNCYYDGCTFYLKIGDNKPRAYSASSADNGVTTAIFINNVGRFMSAIKKPIKFMIQADFYMHSNTVFEFETSSDLQI